MLEIGTPAPDFSLVDQNGNTLALSDFKGKSAVVLFFYPKDDTPGCTAESCSFRDNYVGFKALGTQILGISSDPPDSHKAFSAKHQLPYPLLSDTDGRVRILYNVKKTFGLLPGRASFVIDSAGIIRHAVSSQFSISRHIDETLRAVQAMAEKSSSSHQAEHGAS